MPLKAVILANNHTLAIPTVLPQLCFTKRYDHPHVLAGAGTMGLEIVEQVKDIDAVIIPVGGGGLIAGVAVAIKKICPNTKIIVSHVIC